MTTAKNDFYIGLYRKIFYLVGGLTFGGDGIKVWRGESTGGNFQGGVNEQIFGWWGDSCALSYPPQ